MRYGNFLGIITILFIFFFSACKRDGIAPLDDIIKLELSSDDKPIVDNLLMADGKTQVKIIAYLPKNADESYKTVKFKISAGAFDVSTPEKTEKTVYALPSTSLDRLEATAYFTLGKTSGKYTVSAQIIAKPEYRVENTFETLTVNVADMISLHIEDYDKLIAEGKLKSDGITKIKLIASVPLDASETERLIEFKSSSGTFDVTGDPKNIKQVTASLQNSGDTKLRAIAYLTLGSDAGDYTLYAGMKNSPIFTSEKVIKILPVKASDIIQMAFNPATGLRANGSNLINVQITLTNTTAKKVTLSSTEGVLLNSEDPKITELEINAEGKAEATLRIGTEVKDYLITAKLSGSVFITKTIIPSRANADILLVEPSALIIQQGGDPVKLDVFLKRENGKVSTGTGVSVKSYQVDDGGQVIPTGRFTGTNSISDSDGKLSMQLFADTGPIISDKPIIVEISASKDDGTMIVQILEIIIKAP